MFKNYISVSFQVKDSEVFTGSILCEIYGKASFEVMCEKIAEKILEEKKYTVFKDDITITGINEISRRLYKRLTK